MQETHQRTEKGIYQQYDKYRKLSVPLLKKYKLEDEFIYFNEESKVLDTIKVALPKAPAYDTIDGFGLPVEEQKWKAPEMPIRLRQLEANSDTIEKVYEVLEKNRASYEQEINWIRDQWDRRQNGYWLYINGVPTFMDGWHYFYCSFWKLDVGLPKYRERDREFFLFARFCYTDTTLPDGTDLFNRMCLGFNYPKHRREGATYKGACINYCITTSMNNVHGAIQSMDEPSGKKAYLEKYVNPWRKLPFFFRPYFSTSTNPQSGLKFDIPAKAITGRGSLIIKERGLESFIDYASTSKKEFYDGDKLVFYHDDETGKTKGEDVYKRHGVVKKCLTQANGREIHGFTIKTSTVGEMDSDGGKSFYTLCTDSMYGDRDANGQTKTGLYNFFISSWRGLDGFVDIFGNSIAEDPIEEDLWRIPKVTRDIYGKLIGARSYLTNKRLVYLESGEDDVEAQEKYEEEVRTFPFDFDECFISAGSGSGLNLVKIVNRMKILQFAKNMTRRGNYVLTNDKDKDSRVEWVDNNNGRWVISMDLEDVQTNQKYESNIWVEGKNVKTWKPRYPNKFTSSADPYAFGATESNRISKGAGGVFWNYDENLDDGKPIHDWLSHRTVVTYKNRPPNPDDYAEDMLLMSIYWGAMCYPEINIPLIWDHFKRRGYLGYLKYYTGPDGRKKKTPGFNARGPVQQQMFNAHKKYIELHAHRERHIEVLEECYSIKGVEELTSHDLFVAIGGCYMGTEIQVNERSNPDNNSKSDLSRFMRKRKY